MTLNARSSQSALSVRHAWRTFVAGFGFDHTRRCIARWRGGVGWNSASAAHTKGGGLRPLRVGSWRAVSLR